MSLLWVCRLKKFGAMVPTSQCSDLLFLCAEWDRRNSFLAAGPVARPLKRPAAKAQGCKPSSSPTVAALLFGLQTYVFFNTRDVRRLLILPLRWSVFRLPRTGDCIGTARTASLRRSLVLFVSQLYIDCMVLRSFGRGRPLNAPAAFHPSVSANCRQASTLPTISSGAPASAV